MCMCRVNQYPKTYFTNFPNGAYTSNEYSLDHVGLTNLDTHAADMKYMPIRIKWYPKRRRTNVLIQNQSTHKHSFVNSIDTWDNGYNILSAFWDECDYSILSSNSYHWYGFSQGRGFIHISFNPGTVPCRMVHFTISITSPRSLITNSSVFLTLVVAKVLAVAATDAVVSRSLPILVLLFPDYQVGLWKNLPTRMPLICPYSTQILIKLYQILGCPIRN